MHVRSVQAVVLNQPLYHILLALQHTCPGFSSPVLPGGEKKNAGSDFRNAPHNFSDLENFFLDTKFLYFFPAPYF